MAIKQRFFKVVNLKNKGVYIIGERKFKKEPMDWELFVDVAPVAEKTSPTLEEDHDVEEDGVEISYRELKDILTSKGVQFKKNAPKEELMKLLDES